MSATFAIIGLLAATVAAALMFYFPPRVTLYTPKGEPIVTWVGSTTDHGSRIAKRQALLAKLGPGLLFSGFALQLVGVILQLCGS